MAKITKQIKELADDVESWNEGDLDSLVNHGECPLDEDTIKARRRKINKLLKLAASAKVKAVVEEIKEWNDGDLDSLVRYEECPLDEDIIKARRHTINKLLKLLKGK